MDCNLTSARAIPDKINKALTTTLYLWVTNRNGEQWGNCAWLNVPEICQAKARHQPFWHTSSMKKTVEKNRSMAKTSLTLCSLTALTLAGCFASSTATAQTLSTDPSSIQTSSDLIQTDGSDTSTAVDDPYAATTDNQAQTLQDGSLQDQTLLAPEGRQNTAISSVDERTTGSTDDDGAPGVRVGSFILSPSLRQSLGYESTQTGASKASRTYSETELKGTLTSDWSRHQLTVEGSGVFQKNIAGTGNESPEWNLDAALRLDAARDTTVTLNGGYNYQRESTTDPNSLTGASTQAPVQTFTGGVSVDRDFGRLKGTLSATASRAIYGSATYANGTTVSRSDRNANTGTLSLRLGYAVSPVLTPFVEGALTKTVYDQTTDSSGYARSSSGWTLRTGVEADFGDKWKGELSAGYDYNSYADSRLASIGTLAVDGSLTWSPLRGTDVTLGVGTSIQPSTTAGTSGYVLRTFTASVSQEITRRLVARLTGGVGFNDYPSGSSAPDSRSLTAGAGLTWSANRYVDVTGDVDWQYDSYTGSTGYHALTFMAGVTLKR